MKNRTIVLLLVPLILLLLPILQAETTSGDTYRCRNPNACKEIDDVWKQIAPLIVDIFKDGESDMGHANFHLISLKGLRRGQMLKFWEMDFHLR